MLQAIRAMGNKPDVPLRRQLRARAIAWLEGPRMPALAALLALLVGLPALNIGMILDDHYLRVTTLRDPAFSFYEKHPLDAFRIFDGDPSRTHELMDRGFAAWWSDPHVRIAFFRPLTAASHLFDFALAPNAEWWMHLHSLLYYAIASSLAAVVFRSIMGPAALAGLAAVLFAVDATHGLAVGWVANRNQLVASLFALASFATFLRHGTRAPWGLGNVALGPALLALGFAGGEAALCIVAYFVAYAMVLDKRTGKVRLAALAPYLAVVLGWAIFYRIGGYGASGAAFYTDPGRDPFGYAAAAAQHLPILAMNELAGLPADVYVALPPPLRGGFAVLALSLALLIGAMVWRTVRLDPAARFFGLAGLLALLPVSAAVPSARLLLIPSVGLLGLGVRFVAAVRADSGAAPRRARFYAGYFLVLHVVLAVPLFHVMARQLVPLETVVARLAAGLNDGEGDLSSARVLIVNAPDGSLMAYLSLLRHATGRPIPFAVTPLGLGTRGLTLARTAERTLRVKQDGGFLVGLTDQLTTDGSARWAPGTRLHLTGLTIEVVEVTSDGRPQTVDFIFDRALDHASLRFVAWNGDTLIPFDVPRVGRWRRVEARDPFKALFAAPPERPLIDRRSTGPVVGDQSAGGRSNFCHAQRVQPPAKASKTSPSWKRRDVPR